MPGNRQKTDAILAIGTNLVNLLQCLGALLNFIPHR